MTEAEHRLWSALRGRRLGGWKFRRQHPAGPYILDFACFEARLGVEADGGQHAGSISDLRRADWLEAHGWRVLRFWNNEILANTDGVLETILKTLTETPHPDPLPAGEGGESESPLPLGEGGEGESPLPLGEGGETKSPLPLGEG